MRKGNKDMKDIIYAQAKSVIEELGQKANLTTGNVHDKKYQML